MNRQFVLGLILVAAAAVVGVGLFLGLNTVAQPPSAAASPPVALTAAEPLQTAQVGAIMLQVHFDPAEMGPGNALNFHVAMNTHSVELASFRLDQMGSVMLTPGPVVTDLTWTPDGATSGHHIQGVLTAAVDGEALSRAQSIGLEFRGFPEQDVVRFTWKGPQP